MTPLEIFRSHLGGIECSLNGSIRKDHGTDESFHTPFSPLAVVFPATTAEVSQVMKAATKANIAVIPFGAGTSLEGHIIPKGDAISVDLSLLDKVKEVSSENLDCLVEAGVHRLELNRLLGKDGLFFPVDPGADATIGGMVATKASGTNTLRYGTMADNVLGLTIVLADGRVIRTGSRARKSASGYDLTKLFCGSEGTLGIVTEARLRLYGLPEATSVMRLAFSSAQDAVATVTDYIQMGLSIASAEFLDETLVGAINDYAGLKLKVAPSLWMEFHGTAASVKEQLHLAQEVALGYGSLESAGATGQAEKEQLWSARHDALYALMAMKPGCQGFVTDACVPIARLAEQIGLAKEDLAASGLTGSILGHVGDGNFHVCILLDPNDQKEIQAAKEYANRLAHRTISQEGTITGEHGIGAGKLSFMSDEHGESLLVMAGIKRALDPQNIMNPGKVIPASILNTY